MEKEKTLFRIKDLACGYPQMNDQTGKTEIKHVLNIDSLTINKGEFIVLLGNSGSGKSTLLETLGLMANRIISGEIKLYSNDSLEVDYLDDLWKYRVSVDSAGVRQSLNKDVTEIRRNNFNFIFQENNLMHNLSNSENIVIADLINGTKTRKDSYDDSKEELTSVNLPATFGDIMPQNISGGERQRVAFARATQPDFNILFGDEPTGNLDEKNAADLMNIIKKKIDKDPEKSAIVVSHNIELSLKYADRIILLTPVENQSYYEIVESNILVKTNNKQGESAWYRYKNGKTLESQDEIRNDINLLLKDGCGIKLKKDNNTKTIPTKENRVTKFIASRGLWAMKTFIGFSAASSTIPASNNQDKNTSLQHLKLPKAFASLFLEKECEQMAGVKNANFWVFTLAIFITLLIVGFASGQLKSLEDTMKDPYVNTVDVLNKGGDSQTRIDELINDFLTDSIRKQFDIDTFYFYNTFSFPFIDYSGLEPKTTYLDGRSIPYNDPLLDKIVSSEQNKIGRKFTSPYENGIIVTRDLLEKLECGKKSGFVLYPRKPDGNEYNIPLPIIGIVDNIPESKYIGKNYFLCTPNFYDNYRKLGHKFLIEENERLNVLFTLKRDIAKSSLFPVGCSRNDEGKLDEPDPEIVQSLNQLLRESLDQYKSNSGSEYDFNLFTNITNVSGLEYAIEVSITRVPGFKNFEQQHDLYNALISQAAFKKFFDEAKANGDIKVYQSYFPNAVREPFHQRRDNIAINFNSAAKIRDFNEVFKEKTKLEMDLAKVESMHTFFRVSSMTSIILLVLIIFGVLSIMLYIYSLINMHLYRIRKNIGTLKAFGAETINIFKVLTFTFVSVTLLIPVGLVSLIDGLLYFFEVSGFSVISCPRAILFTSITIILIYIGTWLVFRSARKKYFALNPSELIYSKDE